MGVTIESEREEEDEGRMNNASSSPGGSLHHNAINTPPSTLPPPPSSHPSSRTPSISGLILGSASGHSTLHRVSSLSSATQITPPCPPNHYFRPILPHHTLPPRPFGGGREEFELTSDSDGSSSLIGHQPHTTSLPHHRLPSPHILPPRIPSIYNGESRPMLPSHPSGSGWLPGIFSPSAQSVGSGPLRFDESSFLGTSDPCSSPETGSLPRNKMPKRKRPPRPPPRRLKSEEFTLAEEDDGHIDDDGDDDEDDPHLRHLIARNNGRIVDYGSWPRDTPSPLGSSGGYQQQLAVMASMSMGGRLDEMEVNEEKSMETAMALSQIRTQLQELTKSVESCQGDVTDVKRDILSMRGDINMVHHVKDDLEELRECVERIEEQTRHRKKRLLEQGLTLFLSFSIFAAVLGMFQFGYNTGVINSPKQEIESFVVELYKSRMMSGGGEKDDKSGAAFDVETLYAIIVGIFQVGAMLGGFSGGMIANRIGRKGGLLLNNLIGIAGGCLMWLTMTSKSYEILIVGRFIIGVHCGVNTILVPMYVSEIAPLNLRGALGTVNQLAVTVGLLVSQILGINQLLGNTMGWPMLLGLTVVPAVLQLFLLPMCPESPRYLLITRQREDEARRALRKFRATAHVEEEVDEMRAEIRASQSEASISMLQLLRSSTLRMPLIIAVVMQLSQQLSGINAVLNYSTDFFQDLAGLEQDQAKFASIGIGSIMVGMTLVSIMLMDRAGRRSLHLYGLGGMFVFSLFITIAMLIKEILDWISYLAVIFTLCFVVFFAVGPGSIPWMITAELFTQGPRAAAMSLANLVNSFSSLLVSFSFLYMKAHMGSYVFLPFSVFLAIFWTFTYRKVPETKNKTFEEISELFKRKAMNHHSSTDEAHIYGAQNDDNQISLEGKLTNATSENQKTHL